jgi:hypothetical protein
MEMSSPSLFVGSPGNLTDPEESLQLDDSFKELHEIHMRTSRIPAAASVQSRSI